MAITTLHLLTSVAVSGGGAEPSVDQSRCGLEGQELPRRRIYVSYAPIWARSLGGNRRGAGWPRRRWRPAALEAALEALELPDGQMQGLAESYLTWPLFRQIVARIAQLAWHPT